MPGEQSLRYRQLAAGDRIQEVVGAAQGIEGSEAALEEGLQFRQSGQLLRQARRPQQFLDAVFLHRRVERVADPQH